ncbi:MAG: glycosyl transferase family 1, partial [Sphingobacteriia bacterium]|nr:glycosyl transferase family 1 [Sphingobacteriia bacterium]
MIKVLILTYYWPPGGGAGVQRWLKFAKYMREFGYEPVIYTALNGEMPVVDHSLDKDVPPGLTILRQPIWEPYTFYKRFIGRKKDDKINASFLNEGRKSGGFAEKLSVWIRGNFFIPDARRFWIKPSIRFLENYIKQENIQLLISTGPPHSMHLIARGLKKKHPAMTWMADFRDPWTNIDFYSKLMLSKAADALHHRLELAVLSEADSVISIGESMDRNPTILWKALSQLVSAHADFSHDLEIKLVGKVDVFVMDQIEAHGLSSFVRRIDYLPHDEVILEQRASKVLLLLVNNTKNAKGILTGKFFEYLAAQRPVLAIGPVDGDLAAILNETHCGCMSGFDDLEGLKDNLLRLYRDKGTFSESTAIKAYSRRVLTQKLCSLLEV